MLLLVVIHSTSGSPNSVDGCAGAGIFLFAKSHRQSDSSFALDSCRGQPSLETPVLGLMKQLTMLLGCRGCECCRCRPVDDVVVAAVAAGRRCRHDEEVEVRRLEKVFRS